MALPSVAHFAGQLADIATDLRRGLCCLVVCDKGWTLPVYANIKERLKARNVRCGILDGRPTEKAHAELNTMALAIAQMRYAARTTEMDGAVFALPYLDIMACIEGGWNVTSRELLPLLYENPGNVWLGFQDPTLPLLPIVEKVFHKKYVLEAKYRTLELAPPSAPEPEPAPEQQMKSEPKAEPQPEATVPLAPQPEPEPLAPVEEAREPEPQPDAEVPSQSASRSETSPE